MESSSHDDLDSLQSRKIEELREIQRSCTEDPDALGLEFEELLKDFALQIESKEEQILYDASEVNFSSDQDLDVFLEHLKNELSSVEAENAIVADEIEGLSRKYVEGYSKLENEIEGVSFSLELRLQELERGTVPIFSITDAEYNFKIQHLRDQLEKTKTNVKSMQDLASTFNWFEGKEKSEEAFSGLKIVGFEGNCIRLSLRTFIPNLKSVLPDQKIDGIFELPEQNHELLIELTGETTEITHAEIFPNDVYISEIADSAKSFRQVAVHGSNSVGCFIRRVQDQIVLCTLRRFLVKNANNARRSFEYMDSEETIVAHMFGGIDAFIKLPHSWPLTSSGLTLMSLKSSSHTSKEISLTFLCKVAELANSLDTNSRQTISVFADRVEEILMRQMSAVTST